MFIDVFGVKTNYISEGEGENLLLLHGWGSNIKLFDGIIRFASQKYHVYALDMAGFGETAEPPAPWGVDEYADYVLEFCRLMGITKTIMLGHSFGGRVIIKTLSRENCPIECTKIILTDSAGIKPKKSVSARIRQRSYKIGKGFLSLPPVKKLAPNALENLRKKNGSADYNAASPMMRHCLVKVVNEDLTDCLPKIKASSLLIWGRNDDATPVSDGQLMEKLIPDAGLVVLENCGHYAFLEQQGMFLRVLGSFLNIT